MTSDIPPVMLILLHGSASPKEFCSSTRRNKHGRVVAECSFHPGHENDHRDAHEGATWK